MDKKMIDRIKMVKAMEFIVRQINDEEVAIRWLYTGVADGDIEYGDLDSNIPSEAEYYADDKETFAELMGLFLRLMASAKESGGLYCGGVVSD